jgi:hypothetical protein
MIKKLFSVARSLPVYQYSMFMVFSITCAELRPVYGGLFNIGGYIEGQFYSTYGVAT